MTSYQLRVLAALTRTDEFFTKTGSGLLSGAKNVALIQELRTIVSKLKELAPIQKRNPKAVQDVSQSMKRFADDLRHEMLKVTRTARALEDEAPELRSVFCMPRSPGFGELRRAAKAFIANSPAEVQALFIEAELQPDYIQVIANKLQILESELSSKFDGRKQTASVTAELGKNFQRGMAVLRKLDAAIRNRVSDPAILDAWRLARNVELLYRPLPKYRRRANQTQEIPKEEPVALAPVVPSPTVHPEPEALPETVAVAPEVADSKESEPPQVAPAPMPTQKPRKSSKANSPIQEDFFLNLPET